MSSAVAYRIVGWSANFEKNRTRDIKQMHWVPMPTKHDGDGYTELLDHPNGPAHFGAWCALVQVAAKCDPRGTLMRESRMSLRRPHDAASLSRIIRFPESILVEAIARLISIGWLEAISLETGELVEQSQVGAAMSQEPAAMSHPAAVESHEAAAPSRERARERREEESREEKSKGEKDSCGETVPVSPPPAEPPVMVFPTSGTGAKTWGLPQAKVDEYLESFPGLDVMAQLRAARQWCIDTPKRRKTPQRMQQFLTGWLSRAQNRGDGQRSDTRKPARSNALIPTTASEETRAELAQITDW